MHILEHCCTLNSKVVFFAADYTRRLQCVRGRPLTWSVFTALNVKLWMS